MIILRKALRVAAATISLSVVSAVLAGCLLQSFGTQAGDWSGLALFAISNFVVFLTFPDEVRSFVWGDE